MNAKEEQLAMLFPENYRSALKTVSLVKLKTKYKINEIKIQEAFNVIVNVPPSAYYPSGKSIVLCKLCDDMLYSPDSGETVCLSSLDGTELSILKTPNMNWMTARWMKIATVNAAETSPKRTCVTYLKPTKCWECVWL